MKEETDQFVEAIRKHGRDWSSVYPLIPTRTKSQIRAMAQFLKIKFEKSPNLPDSDILTQLKDKGTGTRGKGIAWT